MKGFIDIFSAFKSTMSNINPYTRVRHRSTSGNHTSGGEEVEPRDRPGEPRQRPPATSAPGEEGGHERGDSGRDNGMNNVRPGEEGGHERGDWGRDNGMNNQYRQDRHQQSQSPQQLERAQSQSSPPLSLPLPPQSSLPPPQSLPQPPQFLPPPQSSLPPPQSLLPPPQSSPPSTQSSPPSMQLQPLQQPTPMSEEEVDEVSDSSRTLSDNRPNWTARTLSGVKKISNKQRRRRQNNRLRRLLRPKNALMVLNELLPGKQESIQFEVVPASAHKVPNFNLHSQQPSTSGAGPSPATGRRGRALPANAAQIHPCTLLMLMRTCPAYRELAVTGNRPQEMNFTIAVDVEGATYVGEGPSKRLARRQAAIAACYALFGVTYPKSVHT